MIFGKRDINGLILLLYIRIYIHTHTHIFLKRIRVELGQLWNTPLTSGRFLHSRSPWITRQLGLHRETISQKKEKIMKERKKGRKEGRKKGR